MTPPLRIEQASRLVPAIESIDPLRWLLVSTSRADERARWTSSAPYLTLGKRAADVERIRAGLQQLIPRIAEHLTFLYDASLRAIEAEQRGESAAAVDALLEGGAREERSRRLDQAEAWYVSAFRLAAELPSRDREIETQLRLGRIIESLGRTAEAARCYQRALVLAESSFDELSVVVACTGLGETALVLGQQRGAHAWFARGLGVAEHLAHARWRGRLLWRFGGVVWRQGDAAAGGDLMRDGCELLEKLDDGAELARALCLRVTLEHGRGNNDAAVAAAREAQAWARRGEVDWDVVIDCSLMLADLYASLGQGPSAESELRRAEQVALAEHRMDRAVDVYLAMGRACADRADETGFVFFEQALELAQLVSRNSRREGLVFEQYGLFRRLLGDNDAAHWYLERARRVYESIGDDQSCRRLDGELQSMSA
jgi:tetratricopeptide (TPR) repeat protein